MVRRFFSRKTQTGTSLPRNEKLTPIIAGKTIQGAVLDAGVLTVTFADGWTMKIKTGQPPPTPDGLTGHTLKTVLQGGTEMDLEFTDGTIGIVKLAEETSSVLLRDQNGGFQYSD